MANENMQLPKSKKDTYMEGFKKKHPEWQDDDEEGFYGALSADDASSAEKMKGYEDRESQVTDALAGSPMNAALFVDAMDGKPIPLSLLERFPDEIQEFLNDPSNADALKKTFEEHAKKVEQNKKLEAEKQANNEETNTMLDGLVESGEYTEQEINDCLTYLAKIATGLMVDKCEKEWLDFARKALNHDADVETARSEGEITGRNANITAKRKESAKATENHANLGTSNANAARGGQVLMPKERKSMWDGAKLNKYD